MHRHIQRLIRQHRTIDDQVAGARYDSADLKQLKRIRLRLRDRIQRLRKREAELSA